jgi:hypothetical protein
MRSTTNELMALVLAVTMSLGLAMGCTTEPPVGTDQAAARVDDPRGQPKGNGEDDDMDGIIDEGVYDDDCDEPW